MPTLTGIPDDEALRISKEMEKRGVTLRCPSCDRDPSSWRFGSPVRLPTPWGNPDPPGSTGVRMLPQTCQNCGFTRFFNAGNYRLK